MYVITTTDNIVQVMVPTLDNLSDTLKEKAIFIESEIPYFEEKIGKTVVVKYSAKTKSIYAEYLDRPLTQEEQANQEIESLKAQNAQMLLALVEGGLM